MEGTMNARHPYLSNSGPGPKPDVYSALDKYTIVACNGKTPVALVLGPNFLPCSHVFGGSDVREGRLFFFKNQRSPAAATLTTILSHRIHPRRRRIPKARDRITASCGDSFPHRITHKPKHQTSPRQTPPPPLVATVTLSVTTTTSSSAQAVLPLHPPDEHILTWPNLLLSPLEGHSSAQPSTLTAISPIRLSVHYGKREAQIHTDPNYGPVSATTSSRPDFISRRGRRRHWGFIMHERLCKLWSACSERTDTKMRQEMIRLHRNLFPLSPLNAHWIGRCTRSKLSAACAVLLGSEAGGGLLLQSCPYMPAARCCPPMTQTETLRQKHKRVQLAENPMAPQSSDFRSLHKSISLHAASTEVSLRRTGRVTHFLHSLKWFPASGHRYLSCAGDKNDIIQHRCQCVLRKEDDFRHIAHAYILHQEGPGGHITVLDVLADWPGFLCIIIVRALSICRDSLGPCLSTYIKIYHVESHARTRSGNGALTNIRISSARQRASSFLPVTVQLIAKHKNLRSRPVDLIQPPWSRRRTKKRHYQAGTCNHSVLHVPPTVLAETGAHCASSTWAGVLARTPSHVAVTSMEGLGYPPSLSNGESLGLGQGPLARFPMELDIEHIIQNLELSKLCRKLAYHSTRPTQDTRLKDPVALRCTAHTRPRYGYATATASVHGDARTGQGTAESLAIWGINGLTSHPCPTPSSVVLVTSSDTLETDILSLDAASNAISSLAVVIRAARWLPSRDIVAGILSQTRAPLQRQVQGFLLEDVTSLTVCVRNEYQRPGCLISDGTLYGWLTTIEVPTDPSITLSPRTCPLCSDLRAYEPRLRINTKSRAFPRPTLADLVFIEREASYISARFNGVVVAWLVLTQALDESSERACGASAGVSTKACSTEDVSTYNFASFQSLGYVCPATIRATKEYWIPQRYSYNARQLNHGHISIDLGTKQRFNDRDRQLKTASRLGTVTLPSTADSPTFPQITLIIEGGIGLYPSRRSECNPSSATKDGPLPLSQREHLRWEIDNSPEHEKQVSYGYYYSKGAYLQSTLGWQSWTQGVQAIAKCNAPAFSFVSLSTGVLCRSTLMLGHSDWPVFQNQYRLFEAVQKSIRPSIGHPSLSSWASSTASVALVCPYFQPVTNLRGGPAFLDHKQPPTIFRVRRTLQGSLGHAYLLQIRSHFSGRDGWATIGDSHGTASVKQQRIQANVVLQPEPARPATQASSYPSTRMADQIAPSTFLPSPGSVSPLSTPDFSGCIFLFMDHPGLTGIFGKLVREQVQSCLQFAGYVTSERRWDYVEIHPDSASHPADSPDTRGPKVYAGGIRWAYSSQFCFAIEVCQGLSI
ncbi:uncharacterized protein CLUP02_02524 [Colletotrichum lupini]|uniref:Uncharacterized protein n=1 Tax=Colletotrichum lupini TaxID=145971 RepID=A0A9Q8SH72_9PEZI|nr:uncharacterized protein CLUP02_02524 [Colletotrichum lupini]UQC77058.1 hypothetical protein CLUP02_02524 [Colletotrichum lupini]